MAILKPFKRQKCDLDVITCGCALRMEKIGTFLSGQSAGSALAMKVMPLMKPK